MAISGTETDAVRHSGLSNKPNQETFETKHEVSSTGSHSEDDASVTPKVSSMFLSASSLCQRTSCEFSSISIILYEDIS